MADPITVVGLVASVVQLIDTTLQVIQYANEVKDSSADRARFGVEASSLLSLLMSLRYNLEQATADDAWFSGIRSIGVKDGPIDQLKEALEAMSKKLRPQRGLQKLGNKLIWPLEKKELGAILQKIERMKTMISLAYNRDTFALSLAIRSGVEDISGRMNQVSEGVKNMETHLSKQRKDEILSWFSPLAYASKHNDLFQRYQDGTGKWLVEADEFREWQCASGKILWCPGMPGAGKTTLASFVVNELDRNLPEQPTISLSYIYCNYKTQDQTPINIVGSILQQLLRFHNGLPQSIINLHDKHQNKGTRPSLWEITNCLKEVITLFSDVFIIVDALDEYDEGDGTRDILTGELRGLVTLPNTHVLVTSRWLTNIERTFEGCLRLEIRATDQDVTKYVEKRIESSSRLQRRMQEDSRLKTEIVETVVERCQGMFLLARLHMDNLATKPHVRAIREALKTIPRKLTDTYDLVMQRISEQNEDDADLARRLLSWLTYSVRPLTVVELQHALAIEPDLGHDESESLIDKETMLSVCAGIVTVEDESNLIRFIHYTTQVYLERIRDTRFPTARLEITDACMEYLRREGPGNRNCSDNELIQRIKSKPFFDYAAMNWGAHAVGDVQKAAEAKIMSFLKNDPAITAIALKVQYPCYNGKYLPAQPGLHIAAYFGLHHILQCLVSCGNNSELWDSLGQTALNVAVSRSQSDCVRVMLADDRARGNCSQRPWTLLQISAIQGLPEFARLAIDSEADLPNQTDPIATSNYGWTALHEAALGGHAALVELLCDAGFDVEAADLRGDTALHIAASEGAHEIVRILVRKNANVNRRNKVGRTPLHMAANPAPTWSNGDAKACAQSLLDFGAEVNAMDCRGRTPLYEAVLWGEETAILLLDKGGRLDLKVGDSTLLRNLIRSGNFKSTLSPSVIFQANSVSLEQAKNSFKPINILREERTERLRRYNDIIDSEIFEQILEMDDDEGDGEDFCYSIVGPGMIQMSSYLHKYRSSWFVRDLPQVMRHWDNLYSLFGTLGYHSLSEQNRTVHEFQHQLYSGVVEEDIGSILQKIDEGYATMTRDLERVIAAVEDIFNPNEED